MKKTVIITALIFIFNTAVGFCDGAGETANPQDVIVKVIKVDIEKDSEDTVFTFRPESFKAVQVIRHSAFYSPNSYEIRGILRDEDYMKWDAFWDDNQGYSIKTMLNDEIARDTHVVVGSIDYVPLGITSGAMATAIAHKITDKPVYIDLSAQEEEARQKKQTQEKDRMHKESVETRESFESANR